MPELKLLEKNKDIKNLKVFLRVDFNVPMQNQAVSDSTKITNVKTIVEDLLNRGAVYAEYGCYTCMIFSLALETSRAAEFWILCILFIRSLVDV